MSLKWAWLAASGLWMTMTGCVALLVGCNAILGNEEATLGEPGSAGSGAGAGGGGGDGGAGGEGTGGAAGPECEHASECSGVENECQTRVCADGECGFAYASAGTVVDDDVGDCTVVTCDGMGSKEQAPDESDLPDDDNECTLDECTIMGPVSTPVALGSECEAGAGVCDGLGACVECNTAPDCPVSDPPFLCMGNQCIPAGCDDDVQTQPIGETDVDCGGPECLPCADGQACLVPSDCVSGVCEDGTCAPPTCDDAVKNATETDVDCGGGACDPCPFMGGCAQNSDCIGNVCAGAACAASCFDTVENGQETGVDCGGPACSAGCAIGETCFTQSDCVTGFCFTGASVCDPAQCGDGAKNGAETDTDCGGNTCTRRCGAGKSCKSTSDCVSGTLCGLLSKTCGLL